MTRKVFTRFVGATIDNILNFERDFLSYKPLFFEQNYRSTKAIVKAANAIIKENRNQIPKEIWTSNAEGNPIEIFRQQAIMKRENCR